MDVGQDHIADRPIGSSPNRRAESCSLFEAAAGVDDGDGGSADDEADIGNRVLVPGRCLFVHPVMDIYARRDLRHRQRRCLRNCTTRCRRKGRRNTENRRPNRQPD